MEMSASCPDPYDLGERNCDDTTVVCEWKKVRTRLWKWPAATDRPWCSKYEVAAVLLDLARDNP